VTEERLLQEIARYDPVDTARVAERARREADLELLIDRLDQLHEEILEAFRRPGIDAQAHAAAVARFLHDYLPRRPNDRRWPWLEERQALSDTNAGLEAANVALLRQAAFARTRAGETELGREEVDAVARTMAEVYLRHLTGQKQRWQQIPPDERGRWRLVARSVLKNMGTDASRDAPATAGADDDRQAGTPSPDARGCRTDRV
jgi:hypothetical protein